MQLEKSLLEHDEVIQLLELQLASLSMQEEKESEEKRFVEESEKLLSATDTDESK